jgi:hypothetical protein
MRAGDFTLAALSVMALLSLLGGWLLKRADARKAGGSARSKS